MFTSEYRQDDVVVATIPLVTGSVAEFYIEPMLPHVGDVDIMFYVNHQLAIPRGHPPPTQLPAEFSDYVEVAEIIDSHLPGYVYLNSVRRVCPLLVVVRRLKPFTALSGTVYRLASSMSDHMPVLFNVFEPLRIGMRNL